MHKLKASDDWSLVSAARALSALAVVYAGVYVGYNHSSWS